MKTRLRNIGNSHGLILKKADLAEAGIDVNKSVRVEVTAGAIVIKPGVEINTDTSTWDKQFEASIASGEKPVNDMWPSDVSSKADKNWKWGAAK